MSSPGPTRILVVGGGYVGMYTAMHLQRRLRLRSGEATITVVDSNGYMTYQPFLPEAAAGSLEPRHVVVSLRRVLPHCRVVSGRVTRVEHARRVVVVTPGEGDPYELPYDHVVIGAGSVSRTLPIPGLADVGIGFKSVAEAVYLRNYVLSRLDSAASALDPDLRRRALTFLFVGAGYAGVEALAELEDMAHDACRYYEGVRPEDMRWVMVEATGRILPEVSPSLGDYTAAALAKRGIEVKCSTRVESVAGGHVRLSDGSTFDAETVVWTAGVRPSPLIAATDLPRDDKGLLRVDAMLRVCDTEGAWSAGDCAAVPDLTKGPGALCGPSAQHAVRQAKVLAENIVRTLRHEQLRSYRHAYSGSVASLGLHKGVAEVYGIKVRGFPAWFMHRTYHLFWVPTVNRKVRVLLDWTTALFFRREVVSLGAFADPKAGFRAAAAGDPPPTPPPPTTVASPP